MGATEPTEKFEDIFSRLDTIYEGDGRTDRRTPADSKHRTYARTCNVALSSGEILC